jgi:hypothetical protein
MIRVRRHVVSAELDGEPLADFVTRDYHELSMPRVWGIGRNSLGFVTYRTAIIHSTPSSACRCRRRPRARRRRRDYRPNPLRRWRLYRINASSMIGKASFAGWISSTSTTLPSSCV